METIDIYDVASGDWYRQSTVDGPGTRARGCAVVAVAQDSSSYNIYYYGGNDGLHPREPFYDDVWVLSLPSFTWTQLNKGEDIHARAGHRCFKPYDDQMMIIGGETSKPGSSISCLKDGPVVMFNLTSGEWMDSYHPDEYGAYGVPDKVRDTIGGDATGRATLTSPEPSGWDDDGLKDIFSQTYDMSKISTWGPYAAASESTGRPELPDDNDGGDRGGGGGLPSWVAPVLGVVLGLMAITGAIVGWCLLRRRGIFRNRSSDYGTEDPRHRIMSWIKGQPTEKAPTVTTSEDTPLSPEMMDVKAIPTVSQPPYSPPSTTVEAAGTPIAELDDTSPPAELSDTGLSHSEVIQRHSRVAGAGTSSSRQRTLSHSSFNTTNFSGSSSLSPSSAGVSPSIPVSPEPGQQASSFGQHQNMRSMSEAMEGYQTHPSPGERRDSDQLSPVSPPTASDAPADDYVSAKGTVVSPLPKSVLHEHEEDLGKNNQ
jgi:hypothetical protein